MSLRIENVNLSDSGNYSCKTTVVLPPPSLDYISHVMLQVEGLSLQKQNSSNDSCILLLCSLEGLNPVLVNFTWIREGHGSLYSSTSYDMKSSLHLCKPHWSDGDTIICRANYSNRQTQIIHIILTSEYGSDKESRLNSLVVRVAFFIIFIIVIILIWILFCMFKYKTLSCCRGPST
ncbi:hypothetical protein R3I94_020547 [Phoxinus phoxinus]